MRAPDMTTICLNHLHDQCKGIRTRGPFLGVACRCVCHAIKGINLRSVEQLLTGQEA